MLRRFVPVGISGRRSVDNIDAFAFPEDDLPKSHEERQAVLREKLHTKLQSLRGKFLRSCELLMLYLALHTPIFCTQSFSSVFAF